MQKNKTATRNVRIFFDQNKAINLFSILSFDLYSFNNNNGYMAKFDGRQSKLSSKGGIPYV